jgi:hypothetical protein
LTEDLKAYVDEKFRERQGKKQRYLEEDRHYWEFTKKPVAHCRLFQARLQRYTPNDLGLTDMSQDNHDIERLRLGLKHLGLFARLQPDVHITEVDKALRT